MWLKNDLTNTPKLQSWNGAHLVLLVLMQLISIASGKVKMEFPDERISLVATDNNTLLSPDFLPFLNECLKPDLDAKTIRLCAMYFDMVYNVYDIGANLENVKKDIQAANQTLESLSKQFCEFFPEELGSLRKQPFMARNRLNITAWMNTKEQCALSCLYMSDGDDASLKIWPICKLTSAGCKWISKQKRNISSMSTADEVNPNLETKPEQIIDAKDTLNVKTSSITGSAIGKVPISEPIDSVVQPKSNLAPPSVVQAKPNTKTSQTSSVSKQSPQLDQQIPAKSGNSATSKLNKPTPSTATDEKSFKVAPILSNNEHPIEKPLNTVEQYPTPLLSDKDEEKEDKEDKDDKDETVFDETKTEDDETKPDDETEDGEPEDGREEDHEHEVRNDLKSNNNMQSPLSADVAEFHEDKESRFFPYFMFLMFVVVTFYVTYHNKSKILALLIEGRRSRSYSRGGSRRKQHSAEYRKLDSNLEEAIQSDGGHVMSTQIIY